MAVHRYRAAIVLVAAACSMGDEGQSQGAVSFAAGTMTPPSFTTTGDASSSTGADATTEAVDPTTSSSSSSSSSSTTDASTGSTGEPGSSSSGEPFVGCGDGVLQAPEACDDGNAVDGDGCNLDCTPSGQLLWQVTQPGALGLVDEVMACDVDPAGSLYALGFVGVADGNDDLWLRKYSSIGEPVWTAKFAGAAMLKDQGRGLVVDPSEIAFAVGFEGTAAQSNDVFVRRHAADGSASWTKKYNGPASGGDAAYAAARTAGGDLIVVGAHSVADQATDAWLRKYSSLGDVLWTRSHAGAAKGPDAAYAVSVTAEGDLYVAGAETVAGEAYNIWLGKYDADGNQLWSRLYNGTASKDDYLHAAAAMDDGGVVVCGYETSELVPWKSFVRRYDAAGLVVWTEIDSGPQAAGALCYGLARAENGDVVLAGAAMQGGQREPMVRRLGPDGSPRWTTVVPGAGKSASHARCVRAAPDGSFLVGGALDEGVDARDLWLARFGP